MDIYQLYKPQSFFTHTCTTTSTFIYRMKDEQVSYSISITACTASSQWLSHTIMLSHHVTRYTQWQHQALPKIVILYRYALLSWYSLYDNYLLRHRVWLTALFRCHKLLTPSPTPSRLLGQPCTPHYYHGCGNRTTISEQTTPATGFGWVLLLLLTGYLVTLWPSTCLAASQMCARLRRSSASRCIAMWRPSTVGTPGGDGNAGDCNI